MLCVLGLLLSACGGTQAPSRTPGTPRQGGELTMSLPVDVISFDPQNAGYDNVTDGSRLAALYDVLLWTDPATGSVQPQMADEMSHDETGLNWTLRIHPGIRFSDGTLLDAAAVQFNWDRHRPRPGSAPSPAATAVAQIESTAVDPADPLALTIKLIGPNANFDRSVAKYLNYIASPAAIRAGGADGVRTKPVGAGPYVLESYAKGQPLVLKRNENYWQANKGLPHLDKLTFVPHTDVTQVIPLMKKGDIDLTLTVYAGDPEPAQAAGLTVNRLHLNGGGTLQFNTKVAPFNNRDARLAVVYALSGAEINNQVYGGRGTQARGIFNATSPLANNQLSAPENDKQKAAALFDKLTANGTRPFAFTYTTTESSLNQQIAQLMQSRIAAYRGVTMNIRVLAIPDYVAQVRGGQTGWQSTVGQSWIDDPEPALFDMLYSQSARNVTGFSDPEVDNALLTARRTSDPAGRRDAYTRVQTVLNREMPFWTYQESVAAALSRPEVTGLQLFNDGLILWDRIGLRDG